MRSFAYLAVVYAAVVGTTSELFVGWSTMTAKELVDGGSQGDAFYDRALTDAGKRTTVEVMAAGYDERSSSSGCTPDGCEPENTRDNSRDANSRWSCQGDILDDDNDGCWIEYYFDEPQDIVRVRIAFYKGDERTNTLDIYDNDHYHSTVTSSGTTLGYQNFLLNTDETYKLRLRLDNYNSNSDVWLSLTEVKFMVD